ncbi:MAG: adenylate/guanylate cyclase domain-containing protein [bacterium]
MIKLRCGLMFLFFVLLLIALFYPREALSQNQLPDTISSLWERYRHAGDDSSRIIYLSRLAFYYNDILDEKDKSDSLAQAAIAIAEISRHPAMLILAFNKYLESTDNATFYDKSLEYGKKAFRLCKLTGNLTMRWRTCKNMALVYLSRYDYNNALIFSREALATASALHNDNILAESCLYMGSSQDFQNRKLDAYRYYLKATDIADKTADQQLLGKCYSRLSEFYRDALLFDDAIEFKQKQLRIIKSSVPIDSVELMWAQYGLQLIDLRLKTQNFDGQRVRAIIEFAIRTRNERLKAWEFGVYRQYLLGTDQVEGLYNFYNETYLSEFEVLRTNDPEMYFRLMAYFMEYEKKPDSAIYYFLQAQNLVVRNERKGKIYQANFFNRFGQFLVRQKHSREAIEKFSEAYNLGQAGLFFGKFEYMLTASRNLEILYKEAGDYQKAWFYSSANLRLNDSISINSKRDQLLAESVKRERYQKDLAAEINLQKLKQGKAETNMMTGGVVFFIIVSLLVYRNFRNQKRLNSLLDAEKQKSDGLLLNILPHETAEELKSTGKAVAKRFDEVTVMFTDFKDFTQASELMSAEELVDEMNFYFSEFDKIIARHNLEKIKIIGDSYMCAGGLPVANKTHAHDMVRTALELQEFMIIQKAERSSLGKSYFELRIGIHTGPVVAGIVGIKKFAYDIWGDTVNTASRMESTSEPNKINISGETFEKVKETFTCTYRGKVAAKHKGEIDMYFVDREIS